MTSRHARYLAGARKRAAYSCGSDSDAQLKIAKQLAKMIDGFGEGPAKVSGSTVSYTTGMGSAHLTQCNLTAQS